ncbi:hypothetical protein AmDm5_1852 [Acetobacter malorum]|nr:hypothetical protein AmDm5_1852 [Acetobacter malorum]
MRTREEQIEEVINVMRHNSSDVEVVAVVEKIILEAERRAEQRVRAEIGRDSERLDFLCTEINRLLTGSALWSMFGENGFDAWRKSIDEARENAND